MNLKELKKEIFKNNSNAITFMFLNYKTNYYSFNNFVKKIKNIVEENKIKDFNYLEFFKYFLETFEINGDIDSYLDDLIINQDIEEFINNFLDN